MNKMLSGMMCRMLWVNRLELVLLSLSEIVFVMVSVMVSAMLYV